MGKELRDWVAARRGEAEAAWTSWRARPVWPWWTVRVLVALALLLAVGGVAQATKLWLGVLLLVVALVPLWRRFDEVVARVGGALLFGLLALVGVNVVVDQFFHLAIRLGLALAVLVVFGAALLYVWGAQDWRWGRWIAAAGVALFGVLGIPIIWANVAEKDTAAVGAPVPVRSALDVMIVTDGGPHKRPRDVPADPTRAGFDVRYSVGVIDADRVRWTATNAAKAADALTAIALGRRGPGAESPPQRRDGADSVLLLVVDGTEPVTDTPEALANVPAHDEDATIARWRRAAREALSAVGVSDPPTPVFALLQTTDGARLDAWADFTTAGHAESVQGIGSPNLTDAAVTLAIQAPSARADFALAEEHRPALLFDADEPVPKPLAIDALFSGRHVHLCDDRPLAGDGCAPEPIVNPRDLRNGGKRLDLERPSKDELRAEAVRERNRARRQLKAENAAVPEAAQAPANAPPPSSPPDEPLGAGAAIYVHPVSVNAGGRRLLYLDYWWYLSDNPARAAGGALCGAGMVIPGATCQDHESDWEGVTVVVDRTSDKPFVQAVHYAQHNRVVSYDWTALRAYWDSARLRPFTERVRGAEARPLVFVAKGTHASYPFRCPGGCGQVGAGLGENDHDGELEWGANNTKNCGTPNCVQLLPTARGGQQPALWNDFSGPWGKPHCVWHYYCDSGSPPEAPGRQKRYRNPTVPTTMHTGRVDR